MNFIRGYIRDKQENMSIYRNLFSALLMLILVTALGVAGYSTIEGWSFFDSLFMTVITITTVGYGEVHPLSLHGQMFTIVLILLGSGVMVYAISMITAFIVEGDLSDVLKRLKMKKQIDALQGHVIVCGDSGTGKYAIEEMLKTGRPLVVVEQNPAKVAVLTQRGILCVGGDATHDTVLREAGVTRARGLIATLHSDADNLFLVLTARGINPSLRIVSKAVDEESTDKLRSVGADSIISPNYIGGLRMVSEIVRPNVVTFLDMMLRSKDKATRVEEVTLQPASPAIGKALSETGALATEGATLVALLHQGTDTYQFNPARDTRLEAGDILIFIGVTGIISALNSKLNPVA